MAAYRIADVYGRTDCRRSVGGRRSVIPVHIYSDSRCLACIAYSCENFLFYTLPRMLG